MNTTYSNSLTAECLCHTHRSDHSVVSFLSECAGSLVYPTCFGSRIFQSLVQIQPLGPFVKRTMSKRKRISTHPPRISKGYRYVYAPDSSGAAKTGSYTGYVYEHRLVMEKVLGRGLTRVETIHHKDFNPLNNNPDNLIVLSNADHALLHKLIELKYITIEECQSDANIYQSLQNKQLRQPKYVRHLILRKCQECGEEMWVKGLKIKPIQRCSKCAHKHRRKVEHPSKECLTTLLCGSSLSNVGKIYGVSSNAVKKWAKQYGIDYRKLIKHSLSSYTRGGKRYF